MNATAVCIAYINTLLELDDTTSGPVHVNTVLLAPLVECTFSNALICLFNAVTSILCLLKFDYTEDPSAIVGGLPPHPDLPFGGDVRATQLLRSCGS